MGEAGGLSARAVASALGGDASGNHVLAPGPGHPKDDRSLSIEIDPNSPDGFVLHTFSARDDWATCRDYVREKVGLPEWKPNSHVNGHDGGSPVHAVFGPPDITYWYRDERGEPLFAVCRWDFNGQRKKEIRPAKKVGGEWKWKDILPSPRPLYNLRKIKENPGIQVLIVEGEKCAEAAQSKLDMLVVTTWQGGSSAIAETDWQPLAGRKIVLWPDNDAAGIKAMNAIAERIADPEAIKIIDLTGTGRPQKWDVADAVAEGIDILAFARQRAKAWTKQTNVVALHGEPIPAAGADWRAQLMFNDEQKLKPKLNQNFFVMIRYHREMAGCFAYNEIRREIGIAKSLPWEADPPPRVITDTDISNTVRWLERNGMTPTASSCLAQIAAVAGLNSVNPIKEYLSRIQWDGVERIREFPREELHSPENDIFGVFMVKWMVSAVARIFKPGCKADCMIILEGDQGTMKSTLLRFLATIDGVEYFTDAVHDIESKDGSMQIARVWIAEIPEMHAFQWKETEAIKSWLTRSVDQFRPPYGRVVSEYPRHTIIAGTLNPVAGYLADATGARRFWPIPVGGKIDIKKVEGMRDQLWAEAVALYREGFPWHLDMEEIKLADAIAEERYIQDPWGPAIDYYVRNIATGEITTESIISSLGIPNVHQGRSTSNRIAKHMRHRGWKQARSRAVVTEHGSPGYIWEKQK